MTDRVDKYLEGALEDAALTPGGRAEADLAEREIKETRAFVDARPAGPGAGRGGA